MASHHDNRTAPEPETDARPSRRKTLLVAGAIALLAVVLGVFLARRGTTPATPETSAVPPPPAAPAAGVAAAVPDVAPAGRAPRSEDAGAAVEPVGSQGLVKVLATLGPDGARAAAGEVIGRGASHDLRAATSSAGAVELPEREVRVNGAAAGDAGTAVDARQLGAFVRARIGPIRACYENALKRNPRLEGRVAVRFTVLANGALSDVAARDGSLGSPEMSRCIVNTIGSWRTQFRPSGPVPVEYPLLFSRAN